MGMAEMSSEHSELMLEELRKIRKLLEVMAEPDIAQRDAKLRDSLRQIVGSSAKKQQSVMLMDGSRTQAQIVIQTSVDQSDLSKMLGRLEGGGLLVDGRKQPKLSISIPSNFFDANPAPKRR
jgi:hypothetical protein